MIVAIVPAAGRGSRMSRPKLTLPLGGSPMIARVVAALRDGGAARVVVVAPPATEPGAGDLIEAAAGQGAEVVALEKPTADMRATVEAGLAYLILGPTPTSILITPGDLPGLGSEAVARVIGASGRAPGQIIAPRHRGRGGHPLLIPWWLAREISELPIGMGVNALLAVHPDRVTPVELDDPAILDDLDTPDDYRRWSDPA